MGDEHFIAILLGVFVFVLVVALQILRWIIKRLIAWSQAQDLENAIRRERLQRMKRGEE